jgi:hypothetical protein
VADGPGASTFQDEYLITPTLDCSTVTGTQLEFWNYFYRSTISGDSTAQVLGSIDDGATWPYEVVKWELTESAGIQNFDISSWADGNSLVKLAFRFSSTAETNDYDDWEIDNVYVGTIDETIIWCEGFETVIPESGWPPTGWSTFDYVGGSLDWKADDYSYEAPPNSTGYFASADDMSGFDPMACGMFTPAMDISGIGADIIRVEFDHHFDKWSTYTDFAEVAVYSGGVYQFPLAQWTVDTDASESLTFDPNPALPDLTTFQLEFFYYDGNVYAEEWTVDNVAVYQAVAPPAFLSDGDSDDNNAGFSGKVGIALKKNAQFQGPDNP